MCRNRISAQLFPAVSSPGAKCPATRRRVPRPAYHQDTSGEMSASIGIGVIIPGEKIGLTKIIETTTGERSAGWTIGGSATITQRREILTTRLIEGTSNAEKVRVRHQPALTTQEM